MPRPGFARRGYSLAELTLVVAIIAVLGALAAPRFANASARQRVAAAANRIEADLALAQQRARARSGDYAVTFDSATRYTLGLTDGTQQRTSDLGAQPYGVATAAVVDAGGNEIIFNGFGVPDSGATITVGTGTGQIILQLDPISGAVTRP